jgi:hypothetical protein
MHNLAHHVAKIESKTGRAFTKAVAAPCRNIRM